VSVNANPETRVVPLSLLNPAPYNPRKMSDSARAALDKSIERFGIVELIVWNERSGNVCGGHRRLEKLQRERATETKVVVVQIDKPAEEKALNVALNSRLLVGDFTPDLEELLVEIQGADESLFDELRLDELLAELEGSDDAKIVTVKKEILPEMVWILMAIPLSDFGSVQASVADLQSRSSVSVQVNRSAEDEAE
jgi:ParB-like chromosome segregation protein Spo0J